MKRILVLTILLLSGLLAAHAQLGKLKDSKLLKGAVKTVQAFTLTDEQMAEYVKEYTQWLDANNPLCSVNDTDAGKKEVAQRLERILSTAPDIQALNLDIKAYYVIDVNAFACPDGTIRVFAGLMELMTDDEILGIIGHEVGHIVNKDSKEAFRKSLLTSAVKDVVASANDKVAALTDSQLGDLAQSFMTAQFSQKAEYAADLYGYNFIKRANKDPRAMASALRVLVKLQEEMGAKGQNKLNQLFASHPESGKRAETLDKLAEKEK